MSDGLREALRKASVELSEEVRSGFTAGSGLSSGSWRTHTIDVLETRVREWHEREVAPWIQAVGLASTVISDIEVDVQNPVAMMQQVVSEVAALKADLARLREIAGENKA
jgi:hypothetical protein